ncbi:recombinase family protein [Alicyclobacillus sp. SP_1]|uniref:recombinase family protein n=1 Tax=Alicyclobacillus sp. SP_1 TaxID=2942475 RepID=UPI0021584EC9|nr:recombinase family protein [Alicyclobacillus sp. SP_1]
MITLSITKGYLNPYSARELDNLAATIKALIYARVSTDDQARHGYSLESQVERCAEKLIRDESVKTDEIIALVEMGEMGDDPNRPALNFGKWLIRHGVGQKFAVLHPDRLARNFRQQVEFIEDELLENGIQLVSVEVPYDPDNAESVLFFNMQAAIAQYNKAKILANSKRGRRQKVKNGKIPGVRRIYGYTFDKQNDTLAVNSEERDVYLLMVDWILNGKDGQPMNLTSVARELSLLGIPAPNGDKWYQATVSRILKNTVYAGRFYYGKTEYKQKKGQKDILKKPESEWQLVQVPAYIDEETYERLQLKISTFARANRGAKPQKTYLLKGMVRCGRCGSAVVAGPPSRNKKTGEIMHHYYICSGKGRKVFEVGTGREVHQCKGRNWRQDVIDDYVWRYLVQVLTKPDDVFRAILERQGDPSKLQELNTKKRMLESALEEKQTERKRWINLNVKGRISDEELDEALEPLEREIEQLRSSIELAIDALASQELDKRQLDEIKATIDALRGYIKEKMPDEEKRKYAMKLIKRVVLHDDEIEIFTSWDITGKPDNPDPDNGGTKTGHSCDHDSNNSNAGQRHGGPPQSVCGHHRGI